jgi:cardiolipin synthase A/B
MDFTDASTLGVLYYASEWAVRLVMLVVVPFRRPPASANAWLLLVFFQPWIGLALYLVIGRPELPRWRTEKLKKLVPELEHVGRRLQEHPNVSHPEVPPRLAGGVRLAESLSRLPILGGNSAELLDDYDGSVGRLVADIDAARDHVHLLYYIFADDATGRRVLEALARAVKRGVVCRVLIDALGARKALRTLLPKLTEAGVIAHRVLPAGLLRLWGARVDLRNHRKIAVIDGRVGYTGSQNLVDATFKKGITYEELVVRVTGPAVLGLQFVFASDWYLEADELLDKPNIFPDPEVTGDVPAQPLPSGPVWAPAAIQQVVVSLIHGARERVVITTPYFVPDGALLQALRTAVRRGVEVHLVVSRLADQRLVSLAQRSYYAELLDAGVRVHRYREKFLHAKHLSIDDEIALIGSSNMDIRSFLLNAEIALLFYSKEVTARLRAEQERYFAGSELLEKDEWGRRPLVSKVAENTARLMSALL